VLTWTDGNDFGTAESDPVLEPELEPKAEVLAQGPTPKEVEPVPEELAGAPDVVPPRPAYMGKGNHLGMHTERDVENRAMAWVAQHFEKHKEERRKPPDGSIKTDLPFACGFLYQQVATDLLAGVVGAPNDARRWYVYLRMFRNWCCATHSAADARPARHSIVLNHEKTDHSHDSEVTRPKFEGQQLPPA
jgi:hypothetical protein